MAQRRSLEVRVLLDTKRATGKPNRVVLRSLYVERCVIAHWVRATRAKTKKVKIRGCSTVLLILNKSNYMGANLCEGELKIAVTALRERRGS